MNLLTLTTRFAVRLPIWMIVLVVVVAVQYLCLSNASGQDAVERGRDAFTNQGEWNWYDGNTDSLKPIAPPSFSGQAGGRGNGGRGNGGRGNGRGGGGGTGSGAGGGGGGGISIPSGGGGLAGLGSIVTGIFWVIVGVLLILVVGGLIWAIMQMDWSKEEDDDEQEEIEREEVELSPVEKLPFQVDSSIGNFLDAARAAYQAEDFNKAVVCLFSHTLLTLDQYQRIRLTRGKTNRQYLSEIKDSAELKRFFEQVMIPFESAFFGNLKITRQQFEQCWTQVDRFHQIAPRPARVGQQMQFQPAVS